MKIEQSILNLTSTAKPKFSVDYFPTAIHVDSALKTQIKLISYCKIQGLFNNLNSFLILELKERKASLCT